MSAAPAAMRPPWQHFIRRIFPAYWIFIFCATHFPNLQLGGPPGSDKLIHGVSYGVWVVLLWLFFDTVRGPDRPARRAFLILLAAAGYAAFDELSQPLVGRGGDVYDWRADLVGALLGVLTLAILNARRSGQPRRPDPDPRASAAAAH